MRTKIKNKITIIFTDKVKIFFFKVGMAESTRKRLKVLEGNNLLKTKECSLRNSFVSSQEDMKDELEELLEESSIVGVFVVDPDQSRIAHTYYDESVSKWQIKKKLLSDLFEHILKGMLVVLLSNDKTEHCFTKVENIYIVSECH
jgi:hypothetical protein